MILTALLSFTFFVLLLAFSWMVGGYVFLVMEDKKEGIALVRPIEWIVQRGLIRISRIEMSYKEYLSALLAFSLVSVLSLYALFRLQPLLVSFFTHSEAPSLAPSIALNLAVSFCTTTDWQILSHESSLHPILKVLGLIPHMFLSPAVGLSCFFVLLRSMAGERLAAGNFFKDMIRSLVFVLIPMTVIGALLLRLFGVEQGFFFFGKEPIAFFEAIKQLGSNGASYFSTASETLRENPTSLTILLEWAYMLILPMAALRIMSEKLGIRLFGIRVGLLFCVILSCLVAFVQYQETNSFLTIDQTKSSLVGKPVRVGSFVSSLWSVSTTATSCGSTVCSLQDLAPASQVVLLALMHTGESIFGGVGVGAISLILMQIFAMFSAGLLVGRTPDLFGKKIDSGTMKLSLLGVLLPVFLIYMGLWIQIGFDQSELPLNPEKVMMPLIYGTTSLSVNNGSQMATLEYTGFSMTILHSVLMLLGRFLLLVIALILAEHVSIQKVHPRTEGSIHVESWTSIIWLGFIILSSSLLCFCSLWVLGAVHI